MIKIRLDTYLDKLRGEEGYRKAGRAVPSYTELAAACDITPVTLSRIANGHIKQLNLDVLNCLITTLRRRGFSVDVNDLLHYEEEYPTMDVHETDVVWAYMTAAAWAWNVEPNQVNQPNSSYVEEIKNSPTHQVWRIADPKGERDENGRFLPPWATCTFDYDTGIWTVKLDKENTVKVYESNGKMVVIEDESVPRGKSAALVA